MLKPKFKHLRHPLRTLEQIEKLRTDRTSQLEYVAAAIEKVAGHFGESKGMIGFCGSPFTLASYMIEGGSSRNYRSRTWLLARLVQSGMRVRPGLQIRTATSFLMRGFLMRSLAV